MASLLLQVICPDGVTKDGPPIRVERKVALGSKMFTRMIEWEKDNDAPAKLHNIDRKTLMKILEWMEYHKDDPAAESLEQEDEDDIPTWDKQFMDIPREEVYEIIAASNYLDIQNLTQLGCKIVANMLSGKTPEEIRNYLQAKNNLTPE